MQLEFNSNHIKFRTVRSFVCQKIGNFFTFILYLFPKVEVQQPKIAIEQTHYPYKFGSILCGHWDIFLVNRVFPRM